MKQKLRKIYAENPYVYLPINKFVHSKERKGYWRFLQDSEQWSREKMQEWQFEMIKKIVEYAYNNVEFYHQKYKTAGYENGDLKTWEDYYRLPCVSKDDIKRNLGLFLSQEYFNTDKYQECHTGGSTDKPLKFYLGLEAQYKEQAFFEYYWSKYGYRVGERAIVFRGHQTADLENKRFYKYDRIFNFKLFDSRYISEEKYLKWYDRQIKEFRANTLFAYPSSAYMLAKAYEKSGLCAPKFKRIFLGSENTYEYQIQYLKKIFGQAQVAYHYGHSEQVLLAIRYQDKNEAGLLGFMPQYGFLDVCDENGYKFKNKEVGEIIGTGYSKAMPFIRYKTDDYAIFSTYTSDDYMKHCTSVERIEGRKHEFVVTKDGRKISLCNIAGVHISELSSVNDMQYEQNEKGKLIVKATVPENITEEEQRQVVINISKRLESFFEDQMDVFTVIVPKLEYTPIGKKIMLKQRLKI